MRKKKEGLKTKNFFCAKSEKKFFCVKVFNRIQRSHKLWTVDY